MSKPSKRASAPDEIEMTEAMIFAGKQVLEAYDGGPIMSEALAIQVYRAMEIARFQKQQANEGVIPISHPYKY
jgi:hypothetical protein